MERGENGAANSPRHQQGSVGPLSLVNLERSRHLGSNINLLQIPSRSHKSCTKLVVADSEGRTYCCSPLRPSLFLLSVVRVRARVFSLSPFFFPFGFVLAPCSAVFGCVLSLALFDVVALFFLAGKGCFMEAVSKPRCWMRHFRYRGPC